MPHISLMPVIVLHLGLLDAGVIDPLNCLNTDIHVRTARFAGFCWWDGGGCLVQRRSWDRHPGAERTFCSAPTEMPNSD
jgi:hypothetical protein